MVARRLETGPVRLGWYRTSSSDATVRARISEGASAVFGSTDVFSQVIGAISAAPTVDLEELKNAWVPPEQARAIQSAVKAAISRKLELAAETEFSLGNSRGASFLFEIDPVALSRESRDALDEALRGDLTRLHQGALPGIRCLQSGWESMRKRTLELDVNLLGIFNFRSFATLALKGRVLYDPATGALVVCDRATADRVRSSQVNFGADTDKLRHVLAESFFLTAAYQGARQLAAPATLLCGHRFFELKASTSRDDISHKLRVGVGLGLLSLDEARLPENTTPFGRTLFTVSTDYNETMVAAMFLDSSGGPHSRETYEMCGRVAIQFLVQDSDADAVRRRPAIEADLWRQMKAAGQPGFAALFPGVAAPLVYAIAADFTTIQWWADAMRNTAEKLSAIRQWLERNPAGRMDDPAYTELRNELANHLRDVAATTREEFGRPWGLLAMNQLVERGSGAKFRIMGPKILIERRRDLAAVTRP